MFDTAPSAGLMESQTIVEAREARSEAAVRGAESASTSRGMPAGLLTTSPAKPGPVHTRVEVVERIHTEANTEMRAPTPVSDGNAPSTPIAIAAQHAPFAMHLPAAQRESRRIRNVPPSSSPKSETVISVNIARVDVRAIMPSAPPQPRKTGPQAAVPLSEYLRERNAR
jgi:hypothetical protein